MPGTQFFYLSVSYYFSSCEEKGENGLRKLKLIATIQYKKLHGDHNKDTDYHCHLLLRTLNTFMKYCACGFIYSFHMLLR